MEVAGNVTLSRSLLNDKLSRKTSVFGLQLWVVLGICVGAAIVVLLLLITIWFTSRRSSRVKESGKNGSQIKNVESTSTGLPEIPRVSREIVEISIGGSHPESDSKASNASPDRLRLEDKNGGEGCEATEVAKINLERLSRSPGHVNEGSLNRSGDQGSGVAPEVSHMGWGRWFTLRELEDATSAFAASNVIGEGGYGIVYHGILADDSHVAVKNLFNNRGQAEREFKVEVEAIGRVRHKNLVRLLGYCADGDLRMLVYEYVNNGNLEQWLHGDVGPRSPLTWDIRMKIITGTAKGLAYLHEGLEPKVVHRDIKSSNILLDQGWSPKVSDFGLAKLLGSTNNYVTTRVMGTFGYVAPEYASTGMLNERSDIYSFGILLMEIITGRSPVDYGRSPGEVNLVEWLKTMITNRNAEGVLDPKLPHPPPSRALKRALLVALRCVDPNSQKRPMMGQVVHMLEGEEFSFRDASVQGRLPLVDRRGVESGESSGYESSIHSQKQLYRRHNSEEQ